MSLFSDQALRLLRTKWSDVDELAKEIAAILQSDVSVKAHGAIELAKQDGRAQFKFIDRLGVTSTEPIINLESNEKSVDITMDDLALLAGAGSNNGFGSPLSNTIKLNQQPGQMPGIVVSGTGADYQVDLYRNGYPGSSTRVSVKQLQIDPTDTIPAGTFVMVSQAGKNFFMLAPVWL